MVATSEEDFRLLAKESRRQCRNLIGGRRMTSGSMLISFALVLAACGSAGHGYVFDLGTDEAGTSFPQQGDAALSGALDAYIEDSKHIAVTFVTLSCDGGCATVQAVGAGGEPPYSFAWEDGSSNAVRKVCPTSTSSYTVTVTDTGSSGEFPHAAETAKASVTAAVLECSDGGLAGAHDGGVAGCTTLATIVPSGAVSGAPGTGDAGAESCASSASGTIAAISAETMLQAGEEYELVENTAGSVLVGPAPVWSYYASANDCNAPAGGQSLGSMTFDPNTPVQGLCFRASTAYAHINWYSSSLAAGVASGSWQICHGCDHADAAP
jgi:hypothetical protein